MVERDLKHEGFVGKKEAVATTWPQPKGCYCQTRQDGSKGPFANPVVPPARLPSPSRSLRSTQGKGQDASRPLGPAPICALGARGILLRLFFEKTPQEEAACVAGRHSDIHEAAPHHDKPGLPPPLSPSLEPYADPQKKGCSLW